jgi:hypothetical protein
MVADHQGGRHQRSVALIGLAADKVCVVAPGVKAISSILGSAAPPVWSAPPIFLFGKPADHGTEPENDSAHLRAAHHPP